MEPKLSFCKRSEESAPKSLLHRDLSLPCRLQSSQPTTIVIRAAGEAATEITHSMPPLGGKESRPRLGQMATSRRTTAAVIWPSQTTPNRANNAIAARKCRIRVLCANAGSPLAVLVPSRHSYTSSQRRTLCLNQQQSLSFCSLPSYAQPGDIPRHTLY